MRINSQKFRKTTRQIMLVALAFVFGMLLAKATKAQDLDNSLIWKISGNGLENPSYLYGTIHIICPEDMILSEQTKDALNSTAQMLMELDMDEPGFLMKMQQVSMNEGMKNISNELSDSDRKVVNTYYRSNYGADLNQLGIMKPVALLSLMYPKAIDCDQPASFETTFLELNGDKEVYGLETVEDQMEIFDKKIPREDQLEWIVDYANNPETLKGEFSELLDAYKSKDLNKMQTLMSETSQYEQYLDPLLFDRNKNWIPKIESYIKDKSTFIAVGAAHLPSEEGVIQLLRNKGYTVSAVK